MSEKPQTTMKTPEEWVEEWNAIQSNIIKGHSLDEVMPILREANLNWIAAIQSDAICCNGGLK